MLSDLYTQHAIYREVEKENEFGHLTKQGNWEIDHYEYGFLQPRSGSYPQANQRDTITSSHVFYTYPEGTDILEGDRISTKKFVVTFTQSAGIGGIYDHQEIDVDYINDLEE